MGNGTKIGLVLVLVLVVVVIANVLDRDIDRAPSGADQVARLPDDAISDAYREAPGVPVRTAVNQSRSVWSMPTRSNGHCIEW